MSKYEELKYVLSGATDWGYEYAKKEDVEAAFAELEERHAMELDQWVLELGKMKAENERLKKLLFNAQKAASDAKLSAHEKSRRIDELKAENEKLKQKLKDLQEYTTEEVNELCVEKENVWQLEKAWKVSQRSLFLSRYGIAIAWYAKWGRENPDEIFFMNGRTFGWLKEHWKKVGLYWKKKYDEACR